MRDLRKHLDTEAQNVYPLGEAFANLEHTKRQADRQEGFIRGRTFTRDQLEEAAFQLADIEGYFYDTIPESDAKEVYRRAAYNAFTAAGLIPQEPRP